MKKLIPAVVVAALLFSCNGGADKGKFTVEGEIKSVADQKIYLEELFFDSKPPQVIDTGEIKNGKFIVNGLAPQEGLYHLRLEKDENTYLFISQDGKINLTADAGIPGLSGYNISGQANASLKKMLKYTDSVGQLISNKDRLLGEFIKAGISETDSTFIAESNEFTSMRDSYINYSFQYADTAKNPMVALFTALMPPVEFSKFEAPVAKLAKRFPDHKGIATALTFIKEKIAADGLTQTQPNSGSVVLVGSMAPDFTMNDAEAKPFSLSQLRGKYVLLDFWASWCKPCREENPNVVAAYNQFKDKNFTVLGVSLDEDKAAWQKAIAEDKLPWQHLSDLKTGNSGAATLYGVTGIPYNFLIDPQGKIIAANLRGAELQTKLSELIK